MSISELPVEQQRDRTENARRLARMKAAENRIRRIVDGAPALTQEQRSKLAVLLLSGQP